MRGNFGWIFKDLFYNLGITEEFDVINVVCVGRLVLFFNLGKEMR